MKKTVSFAVAMGLSLPALASEDAHPLYICVAAFAEHGVTDTERTPTLGADVEARPRMLFVTKIEVPADPLGGATGKWLKLAKMGMGASAFAEITPSGEFVLKPNIDKVMSGSVPFASGELVAIDIWPTSKGDKKGLPVIKVNSKYKHSIIRGKGNFQHQSHETTALQIQLTSGEITCETLTGVLRKMFRPATPDEVASWEADHGIVDGVIVPTIEEGMSPDQVQGILGTPKRTANVGGKLIYFYEDMKITFRDGKLSDID